MKRKESLKKVPAVEKCFAILGLLSTNGEGMTLSAISRHLNYPKSTVFNIMGTLASLGIVENGPGGTYVLGPRLYTLGMKAKESIDLVNVARPYLEELSRITKLSAFLGTLSSDGVIILDKVDSPFDIKVSSEIGMKIPLVAGATGKIFLAQMDDPELEEALATLDLKKFTPHTCINKKEYKKIIRDVQEQGIAFDDEEYILGIRAIAAPIRWPGRKAGIWVVGLKSQLDDHKMKEFAKLLKKISKDIEKRLGRDETSPEL